MGAEKRWLFTLFSITLFSILLILLYSISAFSSPRAFPSPVQHGLHYPPAFGYYLFGGKGDKDRIFRLLLAVYHPRNRYLLQLGADASNVERYSLALALKSVPAIRSFENVDVTGKPDRFSSMGSTRIAATLRAASMLMKLDRGWDWFIALSALDYPMVTQDDPLADTLWHLDEVPNANILIPLQPKAAENHILCFSGRNFYRDLTDTDLSAREQRIEPIVVDPGLYLARRTKFFHSTHKRPMPEAFKVFTGKVYSSPWVVLSRSFLQLCLFGWDNLPPTLVMYFNNVMSSEESYFHSVICNSPEFKNTTVNGDLRYMIWDSPPKKEPHFLDISDYDQMASSGAAFARPFPKDDSLLDMVDKKILKHGRNRAASGTWCTGRQSWWADPCSQWGDVNVLKPGPQAKKFEETMINLLDDWKSQSNQCT
ncbi:pentatricopeptide repeat-containing protein [Hibiscus syriacus]|uniref:Pentatricopeptide repeat-containing protein n=1 Tax=Hibiscus syriacus TaxID=106335 RepID=A0A6A2ZHN6_HIBSY|nr:pentatricopeptide repeat-containing protein [Hibiscus syriacus]